MEIPASLQALLAARLDRLEPGPRLILERAAIEGRRFRTAGLQPLAAELAPDEVEAAISSLDRAGLMQPEDEAAGRWRFVHALVVDAAYRGLSKRRRAELHEELADWLAVADAEQPDVGESVARHLERALRLREELSIAGRAFCRALVARGRVVRVGRAARVRRARLHHDVAISSAAPPCCCRSLTRAAWTCCPIWGLPSPRLAGPGRPSFSSRTLPARAVRPARSATRLRATIQLLSNRVYRSPTDGEIDAAVTEAERAVDTLDAMADDVGIAEAAIALEYLEFLRGQMARSHDVGFPRSAPWPRRGAPPRVDAGCS